MEQYYYIMKAASCIAAALAVGIGTLGPALAQGMVASRACESIGKYPESAGAVRTTMLVALGFIETLSIYATLIAGALIFIA